MIRMRRRPLSNATWRWPATLTLLLALAAQAQTPPAASTRPDARAPAATTAPRQASKPTQRIELPAAEKQALEAAANPAAKPAAPADELVPTDADAKASPAEETTRIEQVRTRSGISEIRITPALTGRTYIMTNREGQQPISATETLTGLSVPKFFTFEFGKPTERPAAPLPPPPSSQSR